MSRLYEILELVEAGRQVADGRKHELRQAVLNDLLRANDSRLRLSSGPSLLSISPWSDSRPRPCSLDWRADRRARNNPPAIYAPHLAPPSPRAERVDHSVGVSFVRRGGHYAIINQPYEPDVDVESMRRWLLPHGLAVIHPPAITASTWYPGATVMLMVLPVWDAPLWRWTDDFLDFDPGEAARFSAFERALR